jgi:tripeptide aminopeptidase
MNLKQTVMDRLIRYAKVNTQSNEGSADCPSSPGQLELARMLAEELKSIGMAEVNLDENGYLMATLPANTDKPVPTIGFLAHLDTATDYPGEGVNPQVIDAYDGGDIVLNESRKIVLSPRDFPELARYKGHTLITTDGTTLLGADDKAGIAEIMTAMEYLIRHPGIKHGKIRVAFTPDEEIGRGPHKFDVSAFGAVYAYTMDGGKLGELQFETFNAAGAVVICRGKNVHPGSAKGKMVNAAKIAMEFHGMLPENEAPEHTEGYEGFYHLTSINGSVAHTQLTYIIRDHDRGRFEGRKRTMEELVQRLQAKYGEDRIRIEIRDQYYNMREKIEPVMEVVDIAKQAFLNLGIEPIIEPVRGGTDGSQLSFKGLPTPNVFTGGENYHGPYEYASADVMAKAVETIVEIAKIYEQRA